VISTTPRPFYPIKKTRYTLYRRLGRPPTPQGRSGQVREISPPTGNRSPRTVQPVASRYTEKKIVQIHFNIIILTTPTFSFQVFFFSTECFYAFFFSILVLTSRPFIPVFLLLVVSICASFLCWRTRVQANGKKKN
jgi:hypothetical protein